MTNTLFLSKPRHVVKIEDTSGMIGGLYMKNIQLYNYVLKFKSNNTQGSSHTNSLQFFSRNLGLK